MFGSVLVGVLLLASHADERIRFKPGATSAEVKGYLSGSEKKCYTLRARNGQHIKVEADGEGSTVVEVTKPDGQKEGQPGGFDDNLAESGKYRICVSESDRGEHWKGPFTLQVEIK